MLVLQEKHYIREGDFMKSVKISLHSFDDIKEFNRITCGFDYPVDIAAGNYKVNAKSIMGLFTFETNTDLDLIIHSDNYKDYLTRIDKFLVD